MHIYVNVVCMYIYPYIWQCLLCICQYKYEQQAYEICVFFFTLGWPIRAQGGLMRARPIMARSIGAPPKTARPIRAKGGP